MVNDSSYTPPFAYICTNLNLDLFQHYSIYSTKVLREIQNAFFNKYSLSIDHTCYLIPVIEYIYTHNRVIHLPQILLYFLITVIKIMCFTITAVRCNSINRIAYRNNSCTYRYICSYYGMFFIVIMSSHQQFDRQFTIHKEVQILTKKQERRTTNLDDTPLYSHANLLSCLFILLYSDFLYLRLYFSFI